MLQLCKTYAIVFLQEHLLYSFEQHEFDQFLHSKDSTIRSVDSTDAIYGINLPRVKGGVSIS